LNVSDLIPGIFLSGGESASGTPWVPTDNRSACAFQSGLATSRTGDENRRERNPKTAGLPASRGWRGRPEHTQFNCVGLEAREIPAMGKCFDFPVYGTICYPSSDSATKTGLQWDLGQWSVAWERFWPADGWEVKFA